MVGPPGRGGAEEEEEEEDEEEEEGGTDGPGGAGVEAAPCLGVAFLGVAQGPLGSVQEKLHNLTISKGFLIRIYVSKGVVI